jgi:hypothetical protein
LETLLAIVNATVPADFLDQMFKTDYTVNPNTIASIFEKNNAQEHLQYTDYHIAATNRGLTPGIAGMFTGYSGNGFSGENGFTTDAPFLCQMERAAEARDPHKKSYQWMLYFPCMNTVASCHNFNEKHAWSLGQDTIQALHEDNSAKIDTRLGKLAFAAKSDNCKSLKFISAVLVAPLNSNFIL